MTALKKIDGMMYLGAAALLVRTHNRLMNDRDGDFSEHMEEFEGFVEHFNETDLGLTIKPVRKDSLRYGIFRVDTGEMLA